MSIPQNVTLTSTTNQVVIGWDSISVASPIYKIERSDDSGITYSELTNNHSTNSYTDTGLNPTTFYSYKVYFSADNGTTFGSASTPSAIVTNILPPTVTATLNDTTVSLAWDGSGNNFDIQRKEGSGSFTDLTGAQDLTVKQYDNRELTYETEYQYKVRGYGVDVSFNVEHSYQKTDNLTKYFTETGTQTFEKLSSPTRHKTVKWKNKLILIGSAALPSGISTNYNYNKFSEIYVCDASGETILGQINHNAIFQENGNTASHGGTERKITTWYNQTWFTHNNYLYLWSALKLTIGGDTNVTEPESQAMTKFWRINIEDPFSGTKLWEQITPSNSVQYIQNMNTQWGIYGYHANYKIDGYVWVWGRPTGSQDRWQLWTPQPTYWNQKMLAVYDIENNIWIDSPTTIGLGQYLGYLGGRPAVIKDANGNYDKVYWFGTQHVQETGSNAQHASFRLQASSSNASSYPTANTWVYRFDIADKSKPALSGEISWAPPTNNAAGGSNSAGTCNYDIVLINPLQSSNTPGTGTNEDGPSTISFDGAGQTYQNFGRYDNIVYENRWIIWAEDEYVGNQKEIKINILDTSGNLAGNSYRLPVPISLPSNSNILHYDLTECDGFLHLRYSEGGYGIVIKIAEIINRVTWNEVPDKTTYTIKSSLDDFVTTTTEATGHAASPYNVFPLPSSELKFRVSTTVNKPSDYSTPTTLTPFNPIPQNVTLTATDNQITVGWDSTSVAVLYKIERSDDSGITYSELTNNHSTNSYTDTGLNPATLYGYKVYISADNGTTFGSASTPSAIVTSASPPTVTATVNDTTVSLAWDGSGNNFDIQRKEGSGSFTDLTGAQDLTVKQYDNTGLTYETVYQYKVRGSQVDISFNTFEHFYKEFDWPTDFIENNITILSDNLHIRPFRGGDANDADGMHDSTEWAGSILLSDNSSNIYLMNGHERSNFTRPTDSNNFTGPNRNKIRKYEVSTSSLGKKLDDSNYYQDIDPSSLFYRYKGNSANTICNPDACMCIYNNHLYVYGGGDHRTVYSQPNNNYSSEQVTECALLKKGGSGHGHGRRGGYLNETKWIKDGYQGGFSTSENDTWFKQTAMRKVNLTTGVVTNIFASNWASAGPGYFQCFWMGEGDIGGSKGGATWDTRQNSTPYHKNAAFCVADQYLFVLGGYVNSWQSSSSNHSTLCGPTRYILSPYVDLPNHPALGGSSQSGKLNTLSIFNLDSEGWIGTGTTYVSGGVGVVNFGNLYAQAVKIGNNGYKIIVGGPDRGGFYEFDWTGQSIHDQNLIFTPISTSVQSINTYPNGRNTYVDINFSMGTPNNASKYNYSSVLYKNRWLIYVQQASDTESSGIAIMDTSGSSMGKLYKLPLSAENTGNNGWWGVSGQNISIGKQFKNDYITMTLLNDSLYFFKPENNGGKVSGNSQTNYNNTIGQVDLKEIVNKILWFDFPNNTTYKVESSTDDFASTVTEATGITASPYNVSQLPSSELKFKVSTTAAATSDYSTLLTIRPTDPNQKFQSAIVREIEPTIIKVIFSEDIIANPNISINDFSVSVDGENATINSVTISSGEVHLTMLLRILSENTVTVSYTKSSTANQNILHYNYNVNGIAPSFTDRSVTNNTTTAAISYYGTINENLVIEEASPSTNRYFGSAIDYSGNYLIIGSKEIKNIRIYKTTDNGASWSMLMSASGTPHYFGASVSIVGNIAAAGGGASASYNSTAKVVVFKTTNDWTTYTTTELSRPSNAYAHFGGNLAISNNYLVTSAWYDNIEGRGIIYFYKTTDGGTSWTKKQENIGDGNSWPSAHLGIGETNKMIDIHGDIVVVSGRGYSNFAGAAYVFKTSNSGETWVQMARLTASDINTSNTNNGLGKEFGSSVAIYENYIIVGQRETGPDLNGSAYIFKTSDGGNIWTEKAKIKARDYGNIDADFGHSVDINNKFAIVGSPGHTVSNLSNAGSAYVFKTQDNGETWEHLSSLRRSTVTQSDRLGWDVVITDNEQTKGIVTSPYINANNSGQVLIYNIPLEPLFESSIVIESAPTIIKIIFNDNIIANSNISTNDFSISVDEENATISSVAISGSEVHLTISERVCIENTVTVSYTKSSTANQNISGDSGEVYSFADKSVTNTTTTTIAEKICLDSGINSGDITILKGINTSSLSNNKLSMDLIRRNKLRTLLTESGLSKINKRRRKLGMLKLIRQQNNNISRMVIPKTDLSLPSAFPKPNVLFVKAGTTLALTDLQSDEGFLSVLNNKETFAITTTNTTFTFTRSDASGVELYTLTAGDWSNIVINSDNVYVGTFSDANKSGTLGVGDIIRLNGRDFIIGSIMDGGSSSGSGGDPYIFPINSNIPVKLPDKEATYRVFEQGNNYINIQVGRATNDHKLRMYNYAKQFTSNVHTLVMDGFFYQKAFISAEGHNITIDYMTKNANCNESDYSFFKISQCIKRFDCGDFNEDANCWTIRWITKENKKICAEILFFPNPHIENGINIVPQTTKKSIGLIVNNYKPKLMEIPNLTIKKYNKLHRRFSKSKNIYHKMSIKTKTEKWHYKQKKH